MSDLNTNVNTNMTSADNGAAIGKAVWDDKTVADMYFTLAEMRGGLHGEEAKQLEERMRAKGYGFTSTQFVNKHNNLRKRLGGDKPTAGATAEIKPKAKGKTLTPRKSRVIKTPSANADGNPVAVKPKATSKPRGKAAAKMEVGSYENAIDAEEPPTKKRKAAGGRAGKKVIETVAYATSEEGDGESDSVQYSDVIKVNGQEKVDGQREGTTMTFEKYDGPEGEGQAYEQVQVLETTKVEIEVQTVGKTITETIQAEDQNAVQTSA